MNRKQLAKMMDHTILKATATPAQVEQICREALEIGAASVCINPCNIEQARRLLDGSGVGSAPSSASRSARTPPR